MMIYLLYYDYSFGSVYSISAGEFEVLFVSFFVLNSAMWCGVVGYDSAAGVLVVVVVVFALDGFVLVLLLVLSFACLRSLLPLLVSFSKKGKEC